MLNRLIALSLAQRGPVLALAALVLALGWLAGRALPLEVLPDITKPTVTILTEAPGLASEEVEARVTQPIENAVQGAAGLDRLRSSSDAGLSLVFAEFGWGVDPNRARQLVVERLSAATGQMPAGVRPGLAPAASLLGEVLMAGLSSPDGRLPMSELRPLADTTVRRRLLAVPGVAEVLVLGGGARQIQVLPDPRRLEAYGITLAELRAAVAGAAQDAPGGRTTDGARDLAVRALSSTVEPAALGRTVVKMIGGRPVLLSDVAMVQEGTAPSVGDAGVNGRPGIVIAIVKTPAADTLAVTAAVQQALDEARAALPAGATLETLFRQADFIEAAVKNLREAVRDGALVVTFVLLLFLGRWRPAAVTLIALPLSFAVTIIVFWLMGASVNAMTLGGLAVAAGLVVDDAIVDVENVLRRLRENAASPEPRPPLAVIAAASGEVRHSILLATILVMLAFLPLLALEGLAGRIFSPIAIATIVSLGASFVVSLTVVPAMCSFALRPTGSEGHADGWMARGVKLLAERVFLRCALGTPGAVLVAAAMLCAAGLLRWTALGREFLPAFQERSTVVAIASPPGTSLAAAAEAAEMAVRAVQAVPEVRSIGRRTGRAERAEHVVPASQSELDIALKPSPRAHSAVLADIRARLREVPGIFAAVTTPLGDRISHVLSGAPGKIVVKFSGPDLDALRELGERAERIARAVPGLTDARLEPLSSVPQLRVEPDRERAAAWGIAPGALAAQVGALLGGEKLGELRAGDFPVDLVLRLPPEWRDSAQSIGDLPVEAANGRRVPLRLVAAVREASGPGVINREHARRRVVLSANPAGEGDVAAPARALESAVRAGVALPPGYAVSFEGDFRAEQEASRRILLFSLMALITAKWLLYSHFRSWGLAAQVLFNVPLALAGGVALTWWLGLNAGVATLVGLVAVGGIAARNGIMMLSHYLHLMRHEGETWGPHLVIRGTLERLIPVLMTALAAGVALLPLLLAAGDPGKEILRPVAVAVAGGLLSSTLLDLLVTPAAFWLWGRRAAERALQRDAPATH